MRKFILMHASECGFDSVKEAKEWIARVEDAEQWRVVEIIVDPVTEQVANEQHSLELDAAYGRGEDNVKRNIVRLLGLES